MIRFCACAVLFLCLLCPRWSSSQPLAPAAPDVVRLKPGLVLRRELIGLTPPKWAEVRRVHELDSLTIQAGAERLGTLRRDSVLAGQAYEVQAGELLRCRVQTTARDADYDALLARLRTAEATPRARPLLLSPQFYTGIGAGAVVVAVLPQLLKLLLSP